MKQFQDIKKIAYLEGEGNNHLVRNVLEYTNLNSRDIISFKDQEDLGSLLKTLAQNYDSKEVLILNRFEGRKFQKCPGSPEMICCNYYLLNTCFNCLYNCTYCFLNSYLNSFGITQFTNLEELLPAIEEFAGKHDKTIRVGTGEYTDSLMYDEITGIAEPLIRGTAHIKNLFLEFKTKSCLIDHLLKIPNKGNSVLAWTLNTEVNIKNYEEGTSSLKERLLAARKAQEAGFFIALHFDPIIRYNNFLEEYAKVIDMIFDMLSPEGIVWISLGCFRYSPGFKDIIKHQFPGEKLTKDELFPSIDGKYKYLKDERIKIFKFFKEKIQSFSTKPYIYLCMEDARVWKEVFGYDFEKSEDLEAHMGEYIKKVFLHK